MIGVYTITHETTGLFYIGCTRNFKQRKSDHCTRLRAGISSIAKMNEAYKLDQEIRFDFVPCSDIKTAEDQEYQLLMTHKKNPLLCNRLFTRAVGTWTLSAESKAIQADKMRGRKHDTDTLAKMSATRTGHKKNPEWSDKISEAKRISVHVEGNTYRSLTEAGAAFGISSQAARYRVDSDNYPNWRIDQAVLIEETSMYENKPQPYDLLTFDIRPVLPLIDYALIRSLAFQRYDKRTGRNPDHAMIISRGCEYDQRVRITSDEILDDFICTAINSYEHTWVHRDLRHMTDNEWRIHGEFPEAWRALYQCIHFKPEYAGMYAHYQRINDSIFLAVPKYEG